MLLLAFVSDLFSQYPVVEIIPIDTTGNGSQMKKERRLPLPTTDDFKSIHRDTTTTKLQKMRDYGNIFVRVIDAFDAIDTNYVERIGYNFTAMLQGTSNIEFYSIGTRDYTSSISFAEHPDFRIGPYFGWRWLFLGYTFDVKNIGRKAVKSGQKFEFSIYTSMLNLDLIYRKTGSDFYLRKVSGLGEDMKSYALAMHAVIDGKGRSVGYYLTIRDNSIEQFKIQQETYNATHDALTRVYNRAGYDSLIDNANLNDTFLLLIDIDSFKETNDKHGHNTGDKVLIKIANIIQKHFRKEDYVCRIGGDEFAIIIPGANKETSKLIKKRIDTI